MGSKAAKLLAMGALGGTWSPRNISGLLAWLDPALSQLFQDSAATTVAAADGDAVGKFVDLSPNANNYSQSTSANRASLKLNIANGRPAVRFSGSQWLHSAASYNQLPLSVFCVFRRIGDATSNVRAIFSTDEPSKGGMSVGFTTDQYLNTEVKRTTSSFLTSPAYLKKNGVYAVSVEWTGTPGGAANVDIWLNGLKIYSQSYTSAALASAAGSDLATYDAVSTYGGNIDILEHVVCGAMTDANRSKLFQWALQKFSYSPYVTAQKAYFAPTFLGSGTALERLNFITSDDGKTFSALKPFTFTPSSGTVRDPSYYFDGTYHWVAYTNVGTSPGTGSTFGIAKSSDLVTWTTVANVDCSAITGITHPWGPKFFVNGGVPYIVICCDTGAAPLTFQPYVLTPVNAADLSAGYGAPVAITGTGLPTNIIDWYQFKNGSTYYAFYKNETTSYIQVATSSSPFSGYTSLKTGDWAGWGNHLEGCSVVYRGGTSWRIYFDDYAGDRGGGIQYSDSEDDLATWTAPAPISSPIPTRNGVFLNLTASLWQ